jgi:Xaa-Pro dipeptidase
MNHSDLDAALQALEPQPLLPPIALAEHSARVKALQANLRERDLAAAWLHAGSNLRYFMGTPWGASERLLGALVPARGTPCYVAPAFEIDALRDRWGLPGEILGWHEHEDPWVRVLEALGGAAPLALDPALPWGMVQALQRRAPGLLLADAEPAIRPLRMRKSWAEIALMQQAFDITLQVQKAARGILREGISTLEVEDFIHCAHQRMSGHGSTFCIVLFGPASSFPHGVKDAQRLKTGDVVLIDTGCPVQGYSSDLTRSYVFGEPTAEVARIWAIEKEAQAAAFKAAQLGTPCEAVDAAARAVLASHGLGPDYQLPGLPHRTGHGIGLDLHEHPYLVRGNEELLDVGMCCSNEPMIVVPGAFGIRLEDHFYMTKDGPRWFTEPSPSLERPFD